MRDREPHNGHNFRKTKGMKAVENRLGADIDVLFHVYRGEYLLSFNQMSALWELAPNTLSEWAKMRGIEPRSASDAQGIHWANGDTHARHSAAISQTWADSEMRARRIENSHTPSANEGRRESMQLFYKKNPRQKEVFVAGLLRRNAELEHAHKIEALGEDYNQKLVEMADEGLPYTEIGRRIKKSKHTAKKWVKKARAALQT